MFQETKIVQFLEFLKSHFHFRLPTIIQKCFCTRNGAMNPTFQREYVPENVEIPSVKFF